MAEVGDDKKCQRKVFSKSQIFVFRFRFRSVCPFFAPSAWLFAWMAIAGSGTEAICLS